MPPEADAPTVWLSVSDGPRAVSGRGSQASDPAKPCSRKPPSSCVSSPRPRRSALIPRSGSDQASPAPNSAPIPVSASPPSWRNPISKLGTSAPPPLSATGREPSRPSRSRVTFASDPARLPAADSTLADVVRTTMPSVVTASVRPSSPPSTTVPRAPAAAIERSMSVSIPGLPSGVTVRSPEP